MNKLKWALWQLLPMSYVSRFRDEDGPKIATWKMWLGRCYRVRFDRLADSTDV
mgnify:CR=1 FL=1